MAVAMAPRMSVDDFLARPGEDHLVHELIDGVVVVSSSPSDRHDAAFILLLGMLERIMAGRNDLALRSRGDLRFGATTVLCPDLFIYRRIPGVPHPDWADVPIPLLVVEILSPSTAARDRGIKRHYYQRAGVEEYWIIDLDRRRIERWQPDDEHVTVVTERLPFRLSAGLSGELDVAGFFARLEE